MSDQIVRCERCDQKYQADEPGCPRCRRIRQSNIAMGMGMVFLILFVLVGWIGAQIFWF